MDNFTLTRAADDEELVDFHIRHNGQLSTSIPRIQRDSANPAMKLANNCLASQKTFSESISGASIRLGSLRNNRYHFGVSVMKILTAFASACVLAMSPTVSVAETKVTEYSVKAGKQVRLGGRARFSMPPECKFSGYQEYEMLSAPKLGKLVIKQEVIPIENTSPGREGCIGKKIKGVGNYYNAGKTKGVDTFMFRRKGSKDIFKVTVTIK